MLFQRHLLEASSIIEVHIYIATGSSRFLVVLCGPTISGKLPNAPTLQGSDVSRGKKLPDAASMVCRLKN